MTDGPGERRGPWTVVAREEQYANPWISVREDRVVGPDGGEGRFGIVEMKPGVCVLPLGDDATAHLVRVYRYTLDRESIEAVAGGREDDEPSEDAARRELREEAGVTADRLEPLGVIDQLTEAVVSPCHLFLARGLTFGRPNRERGERIEPVALPLERAVALVMDGTISHAATAVLVLKAARLAD